MGPIKAQHDHHVGHACADGQCWAERATDARGRVTDLAARLSEAESALLSFAKEGSESEQQSRAVLRSAPGVGVG